MLKAQRWESGDVGGRDPLILGAHFFRSTSRIDHVPQSADVDHKFQRARLILLAFFIFLPEFAFLAVEDFTGQGAPDGRGGAAADEVTEHLSGGSQAIQLVSRLKVVKAR
ncbi:hypothetical protein ACIBI9_50005 [Nonomuraea sp. NPDC050451]|uniref:hypothetical protein n=1 Tax=Nonomuraea sp. NPDC050451 TaxID=3364364 RepID=UPI00379E27DB